MSKQDFKKTVPSYKGRAGTWEQIQVPSMQYLMIDGAGDPNTSPRFTQALETLYPIAFKVKFVSKIEMGQDYVVPPLEGLWHADDMSTFITRDKGQWLWTMMLMVPDWIDEDVVAKAVQASKKKAPLYEHVRLERMSEGLCMQTLHIGSYDDEGPALNTLHHEIMPQQGLVFNGKHHEIYLSDMRKTAPEKLRTLLRQPVTAS